MPGIATSSTIASWRTSATRSSASRPSAASVDVVAVEAQRAVQRGPHRGLVVDDQDARHSAQSRIGGVSKNHRRSSASLDRESLQQIHALSWAGYALSRHPSSAAPSSLALVVGVLAVAGVIDDDPAPITQAAPPSPPASPTDRGEHKPGRSRRRRVDQRHLQAGLRGRRVRPGRRQTGDRLGLRLRQGGPHRHQRPRGRGGEPVQRPHRRRHQADPGPARGQGPVVGPRGAEGRPGRGQGRPASRSSSATPTRSSRATRRSPSARRSGSRAR